MVSITHREYPHIDEQVHSALLPNGLAVFVVPKRGYFKSFAVLATDYGGADQRFRHDGDWVDTPMGVAHFLEHLMFETADGNALTELSTNGANANAYTSTDITAYYFESVDRFPENLEILLSFVTVPYFTRERVASEQGIIEQEILMCEDNPDYCLYYGLMESLFRHNPLRNSVAGTVDSIAKITSDMLYDCHNVFYHPTNMALCVAGDVDPHMIIDVANRIIPETPGRKPERDYGPPESLHPEASRFSKSMDINLPIFLAGCKSEPAQRGHDAFKLDLVSAISLDLLAGHSSSLYFRLYDEGLVNSDFSASFECSIGTAHTVFGGETREPERVFDEIMKEIINLSENGVNPLLFNRIKKAALGSYLRSLNSFEAICDNIIDGHFRGYDTFETQEALMSITEDDVIAFYRNHLAPENMAISIITPSGA